MTYDDMLSLAFGDRVHVDTTEPGRVALFAPTNCGATFLGLVLVCPTCPPSAFVLLDQPLSYAGGPVAERRLASFSWRWLARLA